MLMDMLDGDGLAPMYVLRIWAHCQQRRTDVFSDMPAMGLRALCKAKGHDADLLERALTETGFIERDGNNIKVLKWAEHNAKLIANWENGPKGGRPKGSTQSPPETQTEPNKNPTETQPEPTLTQPEPIRLDRSTSSLRSEVQRRPAAPSVVPLESLVAEGIDEPTAQEFVAHKARVKAPLTARAWADHLAEARKAGWTPKQAAEKVMARNWKGFEAKYVGNERPPSQASPTGETAYQRNRRERVAEMTGGLASAKPPGTVRSPFEVFDATFLAIESDPD